MKVQRHGTAHHLASLLGGWLLLGIATWSVSACDDPKPKIDKPVVDQNDIDRDGVRNGLDEDIDGDGTPNVQDEDVDGDDVPNADDDTPFGESTDPTGPQADADNDGVPNGIDSDDDGDGVADGVRGVGSCDGGQTTAADESSDCDGFCLSAEGGLLACDDGAAPGSGQPDSDGDGIPDAVDTDDDGDGVPDAGDDNPNGTDPVEPEPDPNAECTTTTFATGEDILDPRILLVVDKSGSMDDPAEGYPGSKWDAAVDALNSVLGGLDNSTELGLMLYPNGDADNDVCEQGNVRVNVGPNRAGAIAQALGASGPGGGTPTAATLVEARAALASLPAEGGPRVVVLATDGGPNCNGSLDGDTCRCVAPQQQCAQFAENCLDDANTIAAATQLNAAGFPVFVVGIPGAENFTDVLNALANAGGTAQAGATAFYGTSSSDDLATALEDIAVRVGACRFDLPNNVSANDVTVTVGGATISRDTNRVNGWDLVDPNTIELFGVPCEEAVSGGGGAATVEVQVCPG